MDIREKLEKLEKKLSAFKEKKMIIDEKIKKTENEIEKCNNIISQQKFSEVSQVLTAKGLTLDEIMEAVRSGDIISLQERLEESEKNKNLSEELMK